MLTTFVRWWDSQPAVGVAGLDDGEDSDSEARIDCRMIDFAHVFPSEEVLHINVQRFRGGLVFKAHRRLYCSTLGLRVIKKRRSSNDRLPHDRLRTRLPFGEGLALPPSQFSESRDQNSPGPDAVPHCIIVLQIAR